MKESTTATRASARTRERQLGLASRWPAGLEAFFEVLRRIPWGPLTALSALAGAVVMFLYFSSIGHLPPDIMVATSVGVAFALAAFVSLCALSLLFLLPALVAQFYASDSSSREPFQIIEFIALQLLGFGGFLAWAYARDAVECDKPFEIPFYLGLGIAIASGITAIAKFKRAETKAGSVNRALNAFFIVVGALASLVAVASFQRTIAVSWVDSTLLIMSVWLLVILLNAAMLPHDCSIEHLALTGIAFSAILFVSLPLAFQRQAELTASIAETMGVRSSGDTTLLLSKRACLIFMQAFDHDRTATACVLEDGNRVSAFVLSNVGSKWIVAATPAKPGSVIASVTLPAAESQVLWTAPMKSQKKRSCLADLTRSKSDPVARQALWPPEIQPAQSTKKQMDTPRV